jgi:PAS domain S-box-containing protein
MKEPQELNIDKSYRKFSSIFPRELKELKKRNALLARIVETSESGIIDIDLEGYIHFWNQGAFTIFGFTANEVINENILTLISVEHRYLFNDMLDKVKKFNKVYKFQVRGLRKDNTKIFLSIIIAQYIVENNEYKGISLIIKDITDKVTAEDELANSREQLRNFAKHVESAREKERKRISILVHDEFGKALTVLSLDLSWLRKKIPENNKELQEKINTMYEYIDSAAELVSAITSELRPSVLEHFGLVPAIEWQAEEYKKRSYIEYKIVSIPQDIILDEHLSIVIFRVFQEIFTNIIRHARATKTSIKLLKYDDRIVFEVSDNGIGIKEDQIKNEKSYGILGIIERIKAVGGDVQITGKKNQGSTFHIEIPLESDKYEIE